MFKQQDVALLNYWSKYDGRRCRRRFTNDSTISKSTYFTWQQVRTSRTMKISSNRATHCCQIINCISAVLASFDSIQFRGDLFFFFIPHSSEFNSQSELQMDTKSMGLWTCQDRQNIRTTTFWSHDFSTNNWSIFYIYLVYVLDENTNKRLTEWISSCLL